MDEKTKLYVFTKIEVILIFILVILVAPTFFFIGLKIGISYSYKEAGITEQHRLELDMLSKKEEDLISASTLAQDPQGEVPEKLDTDSMKMIQRKLEDMESLENAGPRKTTESKVDLSSDESEILAKDPFALQSKMSGIGPGDKFAGKYTIQLASYQKIEDAQVFAEGFKIRGYDPIISNVELNAQVWYRVSLGGFDTISDAKEYIKKEQELFRGSNYVISRFE